MTTIAFDGKTLAADRRATNEGLIFEINKIHRIEFGYFAFAGNVEAGLAIREWLDKDGPRPTIPDYAAGTGLIVRRWSGVTEAKLVSTMCLPWPVLEKCVAIGSGRGYALAAMAKGAGAVEAVKIASQFDCYTGDQIDWFDL